MADKVRFGLELEFNGKVTSKEEIEAIAKKVLIALTQGLYGKGLTPDSSGLVTKYIRVGDKEISLVCDCLKGTVDGN